MRAAAQRCQQHALMRAARSRDGAKICEAYVALLAQIKHYVSADGTRLILCAPRTMARAAGAYAARQRYAFA